MVHNSYSSHLMHIKNPEGAHNFVVCQKQCYNILLQKRQANSIKVKGVKPINMNYDDWEALNKPAHSISFDALFNIESCYFAFVIWTKLQELYTKRVKPAKFIGLKSLWIFSQRADTQVNSLE